MLGEAPQHRGRAPPRLGSGGVGTGDRTPLSPQHQDRALWGQGGLSAPIPLTSSSRRGHPAPPTPLPHPQAAPSPPQACERGAKIQHPPRLPSCSASPAAAPSPHNPPSPAPRGMGMRSGGPGHPVGAALTWGAERRRCLCVAAACGAAAQRCTAAPDVGLGRQRKVGSAPNFGRLLPCVCPPLPCL